MTSLHATEVAPSDTVDFSFSHWNWKVQCYVYIPHQSSSMPETLLNLSYCMRVHALTWHGQYACICFGPKPRHPLVCSMYVMQCYYYYYSALSVRVMLLFVHHHSVYPQSLAANPSLWSAIMDLYSMSKANLLWRRTKSRANLLHGKGFWTCLCILDFLHMVLCSLHSSFFYSEPGVKGCSGEMISLQAWEEM